MSNRTRGRITVQHQPTGATRAVIRGMGLVQAVFGAVFAIAAVTVIIPSAGLFGLPFLAAGLFFLVLGIRLAVSKNGFVHRVGYDVETNVAEDTIFGLNEEPPTEFSHKTKENVENFYDPNAKARLEQLESLKSAGLITDREYREKREEILRSI